MAKTIYDIARNYRDNKCGVSNGILFPTMLGLYNRIQFNGDDLDYAVEYGANAILDEIESIIAVGCDDMAFDELLRDKIKELKGE